MKVGDVGEIYLDNAAGQPGRMGVLTGLFGLRESLVPSPPLGAESGLSGRDMPGAGSVQAGDAERRRLRRYVAPPGQRPL